MSALDRSDSFLTDKRIGISRCPQHSEFWSIWIGDHRVTPAKCCGSWRTVKDWPLHEQTAKDIADALRFAAPKRPTEK